VGGGRRTRVAGGGGAWQGGRRAAAGGWWGTDVPASVDAAAGSADVAHGPPRSRQMAGGAPQARWMGARARARPPPKPRTQMPPRQPHTHSTAVRAAPPSPCARPTPRTPWVPAGRVAAAAARAARRAAPPGLLPTPATPTPENASTADPPPAHQSRRVTGAVRHARAGQAGPVGRQLNGRPAGRSAPRNGSGSARLGRPPHRHGGDHAPPRIAGGTAPLRGAATGGRGAPTAGAAVGGGHAGGGGAPVCGAAPAAWCQPPAGAVPDRWVRAGDGGRPPLEGGGAGSAPGGSRRYAPPADGAT